MALPINSEAEQQAVITILNAPDMAGRLLGLLTVEHFGEDPANEVVARVLARVASGRDIPKRRVFCMDAGLSDDARQYLENIQVRPLGDPESCDALVEVLAFHRKIRTVVTGARAAIDACKSATLETFAAVEQQIDQMSLDVKGSVSARRIVTFGSGDRAVADEVVDRLISNDDSARIMTGFKTFDTRGGGLRRGDAMLMAGPTSGGKSALANQLLVNMYVNAPHRRTLMVSLEMDEDECVGRLAACVEGVDYGRIARRSVTPDDAVKIQTMRDRLHEIGEQHDTWFRVWTPDDDLTASNLIAYARPLQPDVLVIDYIGLLDQEDRRDEQWKSLGKAMRQFKLAAKRLGCCIVVLAQFDQGENVVRYSRALREHCSVMWAWQYGPQEMATGLVTIRMTEPFGKNRNGERFDFVVKYDLKHMRITDVGPAAMAGGRDEDAPKGKKPYQDGTKRQTANRSTPKMPPGMMLED